MLTTFSTIDAEKLLATFLEMVRIDSPSGGEAKLCAYLKQRLQGLGFSPVVDNVGNLIIRIPGQYSTGKMRLLVTGHMDVVPPCIGVYPQISGEGDARLITSDGSTVLGADDKAALTPMVEALEISIQQNLPRPDLVYLITVEEETMLNGAKGVDPERYQDCDFGIAFDHTGEQGTLIYEAASYAKFKMEVFGKSVHAGIMPEKGVNAIQLLAKAIQTMPFGRIDDDTTANIGFVEGGKATNIVPDYACARGEVRSHNPAQINAILAAYETALQQITADVENARYQFTSELCYPHYKTELNDPGLQKVQAALQACNLPVLLKRTNGGSDINIFTQHGIPGAVLSAGYMEPHALTERVYLKDMVTCTQVLLSIWEQFARA